MITDWRAGSLLSVNAGLPQDVTWQDAHDTYWLATTRPDGTPHVRPVLGVWVGERLHFVSGSATRKTRHLAASPQVIITVSADGIDLVAEGRAERVKDLVLLRRVADAYAAKYGWAVTPRDGAFYDTEGAPTADPPPYEVYRVTPTQVLGFPAGESFSPTRWTRNEQRHSSRGHPARGTHQDETADSGPCHGVRRTGRSA